MSQYIEHSEGYLAAVWYAMKDAEDNFTRNQQRLDEGRLNPWGYLNKIRRLYNAPKQKIDYQSMRRELAHFAATFGVPDSLTLAQSEAARLFGSDTAPTHRRGK